jgi:hypothetical protein
MAACWYVCPSTACTGSVIRAWVMGQHRYAGGSWGCAGPACGWAQQQRPSPPPQLLRPGLQALQLGQHLRLQAGPPGALELHAAQRQAGKGGGLASGPGPGPRVDDGCQGGGLLLLSALLQRPDSTPPASARMGSGSGRLSARAIKRTRQSAPLRRQLQRQSIPRLFSPFSAPLLGSIIALPPSAAAACMTAPSE